jgi:hypothetical protein
MRKKEREKQCLAERGLHQGKRHMGGTNVYNARIVKCIYCGKEVFIPPGFYEDFYLAQEQFNLYVID